MCVQVWLDSDGLPAINPGPEPLISDKHVVIDPLPSYHLPHATSHLQTTKQAMATIAYVPGGDGSLVAMQVIHWGLSAHVISGLIRGADPFPGAIAQGLHDFLLCVPMPSMRPINVRCWAPCSGGYALSCVRAGDSAPAAGWQHSGARHGRTPPHAVVLATVLK